MGDSAPRKHFPKVDPERLPFLNLLVGQARNLIFEWNAQPTGLKFQEAAAHRTYQHICKLSLNGRPLELFCGSFPRVSDLDARFAGIEIAGLPAELALAVYTAALGPIFDVAKKRGLEFNLVSIDPGGEAPAGSFGFEFLRRSEIWFSGAFHAPPETLKEIGQLMAQRGFAPNKAAKTVPIELAVVRSSFSCPLETLRTLEAGDVLLLPQKPAGNGVEVWLARTPSGTGSLENEVLTIQSPSSFGSAPATGTSEARVALVERTATIDPAELAKWKPGYTFDFSHQPGQPVEVWCNGLFFSRGSWIDLGPRAGVKLESPAAPA